MISIISNHYQIGESTFTKIYMLTSQKYTQWSAFTTFYEDVYIYKHPHHYAGLCVRSLAGRGESSIWKRNHFKLLFCCFTLWSSHKETYNDNYID